jgi:hypothetical protein
VTTADGKDEDNKIEEKYEHSKFLCDHNLPEHVCPAIKNLLRRRVQPRLDICKAP